MHRHDDRAVVVAKPLDPVEVGAPIAGALRVMLNEGARAIDETAKDVEAVRQAHERVHPRGHAGVVERCGDARHAKDAGGRSVAPLSRELERLAASTREAEDEDTGDARIGRETTNDEVEVRRQPGVIERRRVGHAVARTAHVEANRVIAGAMQGDGRADATMRVLRAGDAVEDDDRRRTRARPPRPRVEVPVRPDRDPQALLLRDRVRARRREERSGGADGLEMRALEPPRRPEGTRHHRGLSVAADRSERNPMCLPNVPRSSPFGCGAVKPNVGRPETKVEGGSASSWTALSLCVLSLPYFDRRWAVEERAGAPRCKRSDRWVCSIR